MSAALMAGASLTPSPVMATTSPFLRRVSTISTLCSGATRPTTPMSSIRSSRSCSGRAAKSAPRMASPGIPSCLAMASPVTTSSPVTMRTRMLALMAAWTASFDSSRGGSIIPTIAVIVRSLTMESRSPSGSKSAGSMSRYAATMMRRPLAPRRSISWDERVFCSSPQGTSLSLARAEEARPITAGPAPLTKTRTTAFPDAFVGVGEDGHELVGGVERQSREPRIGGLRALDVQLGLVPEDEQCPLGGVADDLPSTSLASLVIRKGRIAFSIVLVLPAVCWTSPVRP